MAVFNQEPARIDKCKSVLLAAERGELCVVTSSLTLTEVIKIKGSKSIPQESEDMIRAFFEHSWIIVRDVDRFIAEQARDFIWKYNLQAYDAIHLATAYLMKLQYLDTYDRKDLGKLSEKLGASPMKIGEPPLIAYQPEMPGIEPAAKKTKGLSAKRREAKAK